MELFIFLGTLFFFLALGIPIALVLVLCAIVLMWHSGMWDAMIIPGSMLDGANNYPLMAIPFFVFAGEIMSAGGLSKRVVQLAQLMIGRVRGGLGYAAIIIEGERKTDDLWKIVITKDAVTFEKCNEYRMFSNYPLVAALQEKYGMEPGYVTIGTAGEMLMCNSTICFTDPEGRATRHAGRGGVGAVMGSKGLKAIIINPEGGKNQPLQDEKAFREASKRFAKALAEHPITSKGLADYGTAVLVNILHEAGGLPTANFTVGRFDQHESVSGELLNQMTKERGGTVAHGCMSGCMIRCSGILPDKKGKFQSKWPEYETLWAFGPHSGIGDMDAISKYDYMCDDIGVDTIDVGVAMGVAMAGGAIPYGDARAVMDAMHAISEGTPLGRIIGCGTATTGRVFGVRRVPTVKGQSLPAYDPRAVKGQGVTYATSPMGADHTAGYAVTANILSSGGTVDPLKKEGQIELSRNLQVATASVDSVGLCLFTAFAILDVPDALPAIVDMLNAKFGWQLTGDDVVTLGQRILSTEIDFNRRAGITQAADVLPDFFTDEKFPPHDTTFDITHDELKTVFNWIEEK